MSFFKMEKDSEKPLRLEQGIYWPTQYINHVTDSSSLQKKYCFFPTPAAANGCLDSSSTKQLRKKNLSSFQA